MIFKRFFRLCATVLFCAAALPAAGEPPADQSNEEASIDELRPYMTPAQAADLLEAEALIKEGRSDIVAGTHFAERKASRLDPDEDIQAINERGRKMIEAGERKIAEGEQIVAELVDEATTQRARAIADIVQNYALEIEALSFDAALRSAAQATLSTCREAGYGTVLYDGLFLTRNGETLASPSELRSRGYDMLIELDGTQFSVRLPLHLNVEAEADRFRYEYANRGAFKKGKIVLLQIEILAPEDLGEALLAVSAVDTERHHIVARNVYRINDAARVLPEWFALDIEIEAEAPAKDGADDAPESEPGAAAHSAENDLQSRQVPVYLALTDRKDLIGSLGELDPAYRFEVNAKPIEEDLRHLAVKTCLTALLVQNSELELQDDSFVRRAYLSPEDDGDSDSEDPSIAKESDSADDDSSGEAEAGPSPAPLSQSANALFALTGNPESADYRLEAVALEKDQHVNVGPVRIRFGAESPAANGDSKAEED